MFIDRDGDLRENAEESSVMMQSYLGMVKRTRRDDNDQKLFYLENCLHFWIRFLISI